MHASQCATVIVLNQPNELVQLSAAASEIISYVCAASVH
jgi:hypothetical protein